MKVLVTGGAGYVGSHACKALAAQGHDLAVYDNLSSGQREFARYGAFFHGDIRDTPRLGAVMCSFAPDGVLHFAAKAYVGESVLKPGKYYRNNVEGTLSLLEAMCANSVRLLVVSSSCAVYGQPKRDLISEDLPLKPINPYGASKLMMERMLSDFERAHGLCWMALRYFNAAGSDPLGQIGEIHEPEPHLIPRAILAALGRLPEIEIFGGDYPTADGSCLRDYVHVEDLAAAHILALRHLAQGGASRPLNLGTGRGISVKEVISKVEEMAGKKIPVRLSPRREGDPARLVADPSQARKILGWQAKRSDLSAMVADALAFLKAK